MSFLDDAAAVLAGGLPALADYGGAPPNNVNAFPEQTPPTGVVQNYEPGLFNTSTGSLSTGGMIAIAAGIGALMLVVVLVSR